MAESVKSFRRSGTQQARERRVIRLDLDLGLNRTASVCFTILTRLIIRGDSAGKSQGHEQADEQRQQKIAS
ncbi:hypothetical protein SLS62_009699 [Diatrype stigma]|uniref:Uncharacterized protein n=1 Tax=Diatrype stigma TaxID=117547 RepID=A0AAN9ULQ6_9PEZI